MVKRSVDNKMFNTSFLEILKMLRAVKYDQTMYQPILHQQKFGLHKEVEFVIIFLRVLRIPTWSNMVGR